MEKSEELHSNVELVCRLTQSVVKEEKGKADAMVTTRLTGVANPGLFAKYNKQLEHVIFKTLCYDSVKTGAQLGLWTMAMDDIKTGQQIIEIKDVMIMDITVKVNKEGIPEATFKLKHKQTTVQPALESAISTGVMLKLDRQQDNINAQDREENPSDVSAL